MTLLTDARFAIARRGERPDGFAVLALTLSFVLAMMGLIAAAHPRTDLAIEAADPIVSAP